MREDQLRTKIAEHVELIKFSGSALREASDRASKFLIMIAILADQKRECEEDKAKLTTLVSATFHNALGKSGGKGVTEKKLEAETDTEYTTFREALEQCEAKISWIRTYIDVFNNAHLTYRQMAREG